MSLSNRLWRLMGQRLNYATEDDQMRLWTKIKVFARGKRHAFIDISLTEDEDAAVRQLVAESGDEHFQFVLAHEREHNPECPL